MEYACRLGNPSRYSCRYVKMPVKMVSYANDDDTARAVAQTLAVAHLKCFRHLPNERQTQMCMYDSGKTKYGVSVDLNNEVLYTAPASVISDDDCLFYKFVA